MLMRLFLCVIDKYRIFWKLQILALQKKVMKNTRKTDTERNEKVLQAAYNAWMSAGQMRRNMERNKNFTYGSQWGDIVKDQSGNLTTEYNMLIASGKEPITNNLMRQLVKSVVGRFRSMIKDEAQDEEEASIKDFNLLDELDSRSLEEFLISGSCIQRVEQDF